MAVGKLAWTALAGAVGAAAAAQKPHIVLILADDYGWANLGQHRKDEKASAQALGETHTPVQDGLISEGVLLDRHYAFRICSPSRSSLQSGRLALHVNSVNTGVTVTNASDPVSGAAGIPRNMTGIAKKLRSGGYRTHAVGKWDAGMATPEHTPQGRGYETWLGYFQHANDYWRASMGLQATGEVDNCLNSFIDLFKQNETYIGGVREGVSMSPECLRDPESHAGCYEEQLFKDRALEIINQHDVSNADAPLFLFYSFHLLHTPLQVPASYLEKIDDIAVKAGGKKIDTQNRRLYAAMTLWMDEAIGEVVAALKAKGMWDNTLVVFTSDNGGPVYEPGSANNWPLKGGKYTDWEGGVRVNAWLSGGFIPQEKRGSRHTGIISIADWYGTLCDIAGVDPTDTAAAEANKWLEPRGLPLLHPIDSVSQWGFIMNGTNGRPQLHLSPNAILEWPFKLVTGKQVYSAWQGELYPNCTTVQGARLDQGPVFVDLKIFDHSVVLTQEPALQDKITWASDCGSGCLFNVEKDPGEHNDLAKDIMFVDKLTHLQKALAELNKELFDPPRGVTQLAACEKSVEIGGYYGPFVDVDGYYSPVPPPTPGAHQMESMLLAEIRLLSKKIIEDGAVQAAQAIAPKLRNWWMTSLDKCYTEEDAPAIVV